jgi:hypothetical protein
MIHTAFALEFLLAPVGHLKRFRDNKFLSLGERLCCGKMKNNSKKPPTEGRRTVGIFKKIFFSTKLLACCLTLTLTWLNQPEIMH